MSDPVTARLTAAGFVSAPEEAAQLRLAAGDDEDALEMLVARRLTGEPLAWITGTVSFAGLELHVAPGVYVPRPHTELIVEQAAKHLSAAGVAVDVCTGCGAVAAALADRHPHARVVGLDISPRAVDCARRNGIEAHVGDLLSSLPPELAGHVDVITAVTPYVPEGELELLQRDTFTFEDRLAYAGGEDGADVLRRLISTSGVALRPGGALVVELGHGQAGLLDPVLRRHFAQVVVILDEDGDERGIAATDGAIRL